MRQSKLLVKFREVDMMRQSKLLVKFREVDMRFTPLGCRQHHSLAHRHSTAVVQSLRGLGYRSESHRISGVKAVWTTGAG